MAKSSGSSRPLTAGGGTLKQKRSSGGGSGNKKKSRVWFQSGNNKGQGPGATGSVPCK